MIFAARQLPWSVVDPAGIPFDPAPAYAIARKHFAALSSTDRVHAAHGHYHLDLDLITHYGAWASGWDWTSSYGGPLSPPDATDHADAWVQRTVTSLVRWREFLEELALLQMSLREETDGLPLADRIEHAAARYLPLVLDLTGATAEWYVTFKVALRWHVESLGVVDPRVARVIGDVVSGVFESWCAPSSATAASTCAELGLRVGELNASPVKLGDALARWWTRRAETTWHKPRSRQPGPVTTDGHRAFIERRDAARSADRARHMNDALTFIRAEANAQRPLSWTMLREAQRHVLGVASVDFRDGDAFAHHGRERYALGADTFERFENCLANAARPSLPPLARAARVYLDVCFVHPFADGNARAARLALDHVLTTAGLALHTAEPVFLLPRRADDPMNGANLMYLLDQLSSPTR